MSSTSKKSSTSRRRSKRHATAAAAPAPAAAGGGVTIVDVNGDGSFDEAIAAAMQSAAPAPRRRRNNTAALKAAHADLAASKEALEVAIAELATVQAAKAEVEEALSVEVGKREAAEAEVETLTLWKGETQDARAEVEACQAELVEVQQALEESQEAIKRSQSEIQEVRLAWQTKVASVEAEAAMASQQVEDAQKAKQQLEEELQAAIDETATVALALKAARSDTNMAQQKALRLEGMVKESRDALYASQILVKKLQADQKLVADSVAQLEASAARAEAELNKRTAATPPDSEWRNKWKASQQELATITRKVAEMTQRAADKDMAVLRLQKELDLSAAARAKIRQSMQQLQQRNKLLLDEQEGLRKNVEEAKAAVATLDAKSTTLNTELRAARLATSQVRAAHAATQTTLDTVLEVASTQKPPPSLASTDSDAGAGAGAGAGAETTPQVLEVRQAVPVRRVAPTVFRGRRNNVLRRGRASWQS